MHSYSRAEPPKPAVPQAGAHHHGKGARVLPDDINGDRLSKHFPWEPLRCSWVIDGRRYWNNNYYPYDWNNYSS